MGYIDAETALNEERDQINEFWFATKANGELEMVSILAASQKAAEVALLWKMRKQELEGLEKPSEIVRSFDREDSSKITTILDDNPGDANLIAFVMDINEPTVNLEVPGLL